MEFKDYSMTSPKIQRLSKTVQTLFDELFGKDGPPWNYQNTSKNRFMAFNKIGFMILRVWSQRFAIYIQTKLVMPFNSPCWKLWHLQDCTVDTMLLVASVNLMMYELGTF